MPNDTTPAPIGADALREALWICVEHNALHFGETHNTVVQGRAALAGAAQPQASAAPSEQDLFERVFPMPEGCMRCGDTYAPTEYSAWSASAFIERFKGWQAARRIQPAENTWAQLDAMRSELATDIREVFDANGPETPQIVRDVIEYADSWLQAYILADGQLIAAAPLLLEALQMAFDRDLTYLSDAAVIPRQDVVRARLAIHAALGVTANDQVQP